jgi:hypothetical protein
MLIAVLSYIYHGDDLQLLAKESFSSIRRKHHLLIEVQ